MKPIIPALVKAMNERYKEDAKNKGQMNASLEEAIVRHKKYEQLRADWAEKRVNSIFREVARYGIVIKGISEVEGLCRVLVKARYQDVEMEGQLEYVQMDMLKPFVP